MWFWEKDFSGVDGFLGSNAYVWISLALLAFLPVRRWLAPGGSVAEASGIPQLDQPDRLGTAGERHLIGRLLTVR
ncbi:hypothetical protein GCM10027614_67160 [Micromonospora vulcania]